MALSVAFICGYSCFLYVGEEGFGENHETIALKKPASGRSEDPRTKLLQSKKIQSYLNIDNAEVNGEESAWDLFRLISQGDFTDEQKETRYKKVIQKLTESEGLEAALAFIAKNEFPVKDSGGLVTVAFMYSELDLKANLEVFSRIKDSDKKEAALVGIKLYAKISGGLSLREIPNKLYEYKELRPILVQSFVVSVFSDSLPNLKPSKFSDLMPLFINDLTNFTQDKEFGVDIYRDALSEVAKYFPFEVWEQMIEAEVKDPILVKNLIREIMDKDYLQAVKELEEIGKSGHPVSKEISFIADKMVKNNDFKRAADWVSKIEDEKEKENALWRIWKQQEREVTSEARRNPEETVEYLLREDSRYEKRFLETAISRWIEGESDAAAEWVETNIRELSDDARQYVAASYAKEAAAQGDMATARQWANLIQDEKTLTRINGIIEKAEQAASN